MTSEKRIKLLHDLLLKYRTQPKNTNPKPGFQLLLNPVFRVWQNGRVSPRARVFQSPGFNHLSICYALVRSI